MYGYWGASDTSVVRVADLSMEFREGKTLWGLVKDLHTPTPSPTGQGSQEIRDLRPCPHVRRGQDGGMIRAQSSSDVLGGRAGCCAPSARVIKGWNQADKAGRDCVTRAVRYSSSTDSHACMNRWLILRGARDGVRWAPLPCPVKLGREPPPLPAGVASETRKPRAVRPGKWRINP